MINRSAFWTLLSCVVGVILSHAARAADPIAEKPSEQTKFSEAETLLWFGDQLKKITQPVVLEYSFVKAGTYEDGFTDAVVFTVQKVKPDGMKTASLEFFTGERRFPIPPEENTNVNPVLKVYFQGDVYEMNRLTDPDGKSRERWRYFQRRIKYALADGAKIEPFQIDLDGKSYAGKRVMFTPYAEDPKREHFKEFARKVYTVIVADELPGFVYRIETVVPGNTAGAAPLIKETLQLTAIKPVRNSP